MQQNYEPIKTSKYFTELDKYHYIATHLKNCNINFTLNNLINLSAKQDFLSNSIAEIEFVPENSVTTENSQYNEDLIIALQKLRVTPSWWNPFGKPYQSTDPAVLSDVLIAILNCLSLTIILI
jgi:peptidase E